jgi:hypothetical protein
MHSPERLRSTHGLETRRRTGSSGALRLRSWSTRRSVTTARIRSLIGRCMAATRRYANGHGVAGSC